MAAAKSAAVSAPKPERSLTPERERFALSGPSRPLDLSTNAARRDLADIRLAGRWFAPHYVVPETWTCRADCVLRAAPSDGAEVHGELTSGQAFSVLEVSGAWAWGFRQTDSRVGYVEASALEQAATQKP